jgi:hypothetical protein
MRFRKEEEKRDGSQREREREREGEKVGWLDVIVDR